MRLAGTFHTSAKRVDTVKLRVEVENLPAAAEVIVTDLQLQAGAGHSGYAFAPEDIDIIPRDRYYVNGTITRSQPVMMLSNMLLSGGMRLEVLDADTPVRLGTYHFGHVRGEAVADGEQHSATHGHGRVPIITERCDLQADAELERKIHLRGSWADRREVKPA